jgi:hypothetical protein
MFEVIEPSLLIVNSVVAKPFCYSENVVLHRRIITDRNYCMFLGRNIVTWFWLLPRISIL